MDLRFFMVLAPVLLVACGNAPDEQAAEPATAPAQAATAALPVDGFFSDLPQFVDVGEIRQIGARAEARQATLDRLNLRYGLVIEAHKDQLKGAKVLDLGSYDGRWAYAAIEAGAEHVTGIEINKDFTDQAGRNLAGLGVADDKFDFIVGDVLAELKKVEPGTLDGIICAGIYYHITYHVELMKEFKRLGVDWIIMDSSVVVNEKPVVQWSVAPYGLEGTPSPAAIELIAEQADFEYTYVPTDNFEHPGMWDYISGNRITMLLF